MEAFSKRESAQIRGELFPCPGLSHPYNRERRHEFLCGGFVLLQQIFDQKALDLPLASERRRLAATAPVEPHFRFVSGQFHDSAKDPSERKGG